MGLFRKIIFLGGVVFAMPSPPATLTANSAMQATDNSTSWTYFSAAADTVADFNSFCVRKPQVCTTAKYLTASIEGKAKYSAKLIYEWANESTKSQTANLPQGVAENDPINTGTVKLRGAVAENSTLKMEDLVPEWHGTINPNKG